MYTMDDLVIPKSYWISIFSEVGSKYFGDNILYFIRLWNRYEDCYFYKLGFTDDLRKRIISINSEYDACGRIVIIALCHIKSQKTEKIQYRALSKLNMKLVIKQKRKKECYPISANAYDSIIKFMKKHQVGSCFFESQNYVLSDSDEETLDGDSLNKDFEEEKLWHVRIGRFFK